MTHVCTPKIEGLCLVSVFIGTLFILYPPFVLAQSISFLPVMTYYSGGDFATLVAVGDLNGDGIPDLVVENSESGVVGVLLGNGDGTFQPAVTYSTGGEGNNIFNSGLALADVNGDGKLDLLVTNPCGMYNCVVSAVEGTVGVLLGNGNGTFQPAVTYATGGVVTQAVHVADVNGDGKLDLIVANSCGLNDCFRSPTEGTVGVLLGNGDGTFRPALLYPSGASWASGIAVADANGDGKLDLIVANTCAYCGGNGLVAVLFGNGDGTFQAAVSYDSGGISGTKPSSVAVADLNGDGKPDILVTNFRSNTVGVLLGNGDGIFQPVVTYGSGGDGMPTSIAVTDVNGDGKLDLLVANYSGGGNSDGTVGVLLGNGNGTFQTAKDYDTGGWGPTSIAIADVNGDGRPDILVADLFTYANYTPGLVGVLLNNTPFCTSAPTITLSATPKSLWPPDRKMVPVAVFGKVTDTGCTIRTAAYAVKDEYGEVQPSGTVTLGVGGAFSFTVWLQASRLGTDLDGRLYKVTVRASNNAGKTGSNVANVVVPHDQGH